MRIGIPKEIKNHEYRVGATPAMTQMLVDAGHDVFVQIGAGASVGFGDTDYIEAGCTMTPDAASTWEAEMIIKVKERNGKKT